MPELRQDSRLRTHVRTVATRQQLVQVALDLGREGGERQVLGGTREGLGDEGPNPFQLRLGWRVHRWRPVNSMGDEHHRLLTGVITEARLLRDENKLNPYEDEWLEEIDDWFNEHLPCPPFSTGEFPRSAVAWFKAESREFITRMWDIVAIIEGHDVPVRLLKSQNPGKILYEDKYQVLVEEWRHL